MIRALLMQRAARFGAAVVALSMMLTGSVYAYTFDPDGAGGSGAIEIVGFDWDVTSFLAKGGVTAIQNFAAAQQAGQTCTSCSFEVITHSKLVAAVDVNNNNLLPNSFSGANPTTEITMIAKFTETVTSVTGNTANFAVDTTQPLYIEIYFDNTPNAVPVSGSGYNDGLLILKGTALLDSSGNFSVNLGTSGDPVTQVLDQSANGNDYDGQETVTGQGSQGVLTVGGLTVDNNFFQDALAAFGLTFSNVSINLPFNTVTPSDCFTDYNAATGSGVAVGSSTGAANTLQCQPGHFDGLMSANNDLSLNGGYLPNIGPINGGFPSGPGGPDFIAQTDFNSSLTPAVPEPTSLLMFGFGLIGISGYLRARNRKTK